MFEPGTKVQLISGQRNPYERPVVRSWCQREVTFLDWNSAGILWSPEDGITEFTPWHSVDGMWQYREEEQ